MLAQSTIPYSILTAMFAVRTQAQTVVSDVRNELIILT